MSSPDSKAVMFDRRAPFMPKTYPAWMLDAQATLAEDLLKRAFAMPGTETMEVSEVVNRALHAADYFYEKAEQQGHLVATPPYEDVEAANKADIERIEARRKGDVEACRSGLGATFARLFGLFRPNRPASA